MNYVKNGNVFHPCDSGLTCACLLIALFSLSVPVVAAAAATEDSVYLFTSFHESDQKYLRFLYSFDGYHWTNVPGTFLQAMLERTNCL